MNIVGLANVYAHLDDAGLNIGTRDGWVNMRTGIAGNRRFLAVANLVALQEMGCLLTVIFHRTPARQ